MLKRLTCLLLACVCLFTCAAVAETEREPNPIEVIPYDQLPEPHEGQHHYLLLCAGDNWVVDPDKLTHVDGMVLLTLDTRSQRVMITSLIRDALVVRPDGKIGRINNIAKEWGPEALMKTISEHLGVKIEKYILFSMKQVANIIDHLGGVEITVDSSEALYLRKYPLDAHQTSPRMGYAGTYTFYGRAAVIYMRIRKAGTGGDFTRTQRVRTVLSTLADTCRNITHEQAESLLDSIVENNLLTNMNMQDMLQAMEQAFSLRHCTVEELRIPPEGAYHPLTYAGMSTQELDWNACRASMQNFLSSSFLVLDDEEE